MAHEIAEHPSPRTPRRRARARVLPCAARLAALIACAAAPAFAQTLPAGEPVATHPDGQVSPSRPAETAPAGENRRLRRRVRELERQVEALREPEIPWFWLALGFAGQFVFGMRFVVQWIATERRKRSVVPLSFWYLSLLGTVVLLAYSIYLRNPVFIAGFSLNMVIYLRNLYYIHIHPRRSGEVVGNGGDGSTEG